MLYDVTETSAFFTHTEQVPAVTELVEIHSNAKLVLKGKLTARSSVLHHLNLLKDVKCKCASGPPSKYKRRRLEPREKSEIGGVKHEHVSSITAIVDLDDITTALEHITGFRPKLDALSTEMHDYNGDSIGFRCLETTSRFPGVHVANCTHEFQLVTVKNKTAWDTSPLHIEDLKLVLPPSSECLNDPWRAPIIVHDALLARFIHIAHVHRGKDNCGSAAHVRICCMRSSLHYAGCADLISLSIKQGKCWVHLTTQLNLLNE